MTEKQFARVMKQIADSMRAQGYRVQIEGGGAPRILVSGPGELHCVENDEAWEIMEDLPSFLDIDDYILWLASGW